MTVDWEREDMGVGANPPARRGGSWIPIPLEAVKYEAEVVTEYGLRTRIVISLWINDVDTRGKWQPNACIIERNNNYSRRKGKLQKRMEP